MSSHGSQEISEKQAISPVVEPKHDPVALKPGKKAKKVHNAELYAAIQESNINPRSKESFQLYLCIFVAFLCACANGYDGSLMTSILAMKHFQDTFHSGTTGSTVSVIFSLYTVGAMVGAPFAAVLSDRYGRKKGMFVGGAVIITGMIIISTSNKIAQFIVGRFVLGLGIAVMTVAAPAYAIEISPPHWRGRCTGFYNCGWFGGAIPAAIVTFGTNYIDSDYSWRIPLILQAAACVVVMASVMFLPESPRFLMANGREEEAIAFLTKYHGNGNRQSPLVVLEVDEMREGDRKSVV